MALLFIAVLAAISIESLVSTVSFNITEAVRFVNKQHDKKFCFKTKPPLMQEGIYCVTRER